MNKHERLISIQHLRELIALNPETGKLYWKVRDVSLFKDGTQTARQRCAIWNGKYAGREAAASLHKDGGLYGTIDGRIYWAHSIVFTLLHGRWPEIYGYHQNHGRKSA